MGQSANKVNQYIKDRLSQMSEISDKIDSITEYTNRLLGDYIGIESKYRKISVKDLISNLSKEKQILQDELDKLQLMEDVERFLKEDDNIYY